MKGNIGKKFLSLFLSAVMVLGMLPTTAFATEGEEIVCGHHPEHTTECGYVQAVDGVACGHVHDEECGYAAAVEEVRCECTDTDADEVVDHVEGCGYVAPVAEQECKHKAEGCSEEVCGYVAAVPGSPCTFDPAQCELCKAEQQIVADETDEAVAAVQAMIDALDIESETLEEDILAVDEAIDALTSEQLAQIDWTNYTAAEEALGAAEKATLEEPVNVIVYAAIDETTAQVTDGKSAVGDVEIPETVIIDGKEYTVTAIAGNAFNDANEVTSITVPNTVTSLGGAAFANMDKLTALYIGSGVTSWGSKLAVNNSELETVVLAEGATLIGDLAFRTCPKLKNVTLPSTLKTIGGTAFAYAAIEELTIPASVETIGADAFKDIDTLKKVTFLGENTKLGSTCFQMCDALETVVLPENLTVIPQGAFRYCTALKNIEFPEMLTEIGNYSFQGCTSLESVTISKNITNLVTNAFNGCTSLTDLTIEEGFAGTIGGYVFQGCTALETVVIPSSMETVGESMFNMCSSLKNVTLSEGVKTLNISAFANCTSLESLTLPDSLERMRHGSIANCTALKELIIEGDNLPVIEHANALDGLTEELVVVYDGEDELTGNWSALAEQTKTSEEYEDDKIANAFTGTITEDMVWNDGDLIGNVTISGDVTITVKGTVVLVGTIRLSPDSISKVTFEGENNAKLIRGSKFTGQMFYAEGVSGNFQSLTFNNITLDGGAVWTGDVDKTLNRGTTNDGVKATGSVLYLVYANAKLNESVLQNHDDSTGEKANAVFLRYYSTIAFNDSVVRNNNSISTYYRGGVITVRQGGTVTTDNAEVYGNSGAAGGFFGISSTGSYGGIAEVKDSKFHNNYSDNGAVFLMQCNSNKGYLSIDGCEFYENASKTAVLTEWAYSRPFIIKDSYFHDNECAVWDCHADPVLDLSGKIVVEEDPDYTKYLFETPLVLSGPLASGSSIAISEASLQKLMGSNNSGYIITGTADYAVTEADLAKLKLPEGYTFFLADVNGDNVKDVVASKADTVTSVKLTLKDSLDTSASAYEFVYSNIVSLPVCPFEHEGLTFNNWTNAEGNIVSKQEFKAPATLTAQWKPTDPVVKLSRDNATLKATVQNPFETLSYTYQWYMDDVVIDGATSETYTMTDVNAHKYKCTVTASYAGLEPTTGSASGTSSAPAIAQVGETKYASVQAAIDAIVDSGEAATITLLDDIVLDDINDVEAREALSNGNGAYCGFDYGNGAFFNVIGGNVTVDLNGHSITYDLHDDAWCNKRVVSIFYVTDKANLTIVDNSEDKTGAVTVYGMATAAYSVAVFTKVNIEGGTWTWNPCKTCGATNAFLYASHGGELYITGGKFVNNVDGDAGDYMIFSHYSSKETTENWAGVDYDSTKIAISGGIFDGYNPGEIKYMDQGNGNAEAMDDGCAKGYKAVDNGDGTYGVKEDPTQKIYYVATKAELNDALGKAVDGNVIKLTADIDYGTDHLEITKAIKLDLGGKTLTTRARNYGIAMKKDGCTVTNGKLNHAGTVAAIKVWDAAAITDLEIDVTGTSSSGNTIDGIVVQENAAGVGLIKNVMIYSTAGQGVDSGIKTHNCGNATAPVIGAMENVNVDAKTVAANIYAPCGTATGCTFKGGVSGIEIWIKGTYSASLDLVNCTVEGGTQAVYAHDEFNSNPVTNDGTITLTADEDTTFTGPAKLTKILNQAAETQVALPEALTEGVATVNGRYYATLSAAIEAANAVEGGATVALLADVTLGEMLTISGNVTISGEHTITRADTYTGTLFTVNAGAELTLDGGLTIDGNNEWTLNTELYNKALNREVTGVTWEQLITSEENAPNATAAMFVVNGSVVAKDVTIQNNYSTKDSNSGDGGIFKVEANATLTMTGAAIKHIVTHGANSVAHLSTNAVWTMNDGSLITDTFAGKNGGVCRNDSGKFVMNGGTIEKNNSINTNGTVIMLYKGAMEMNGGKICSNTGISGTANGRCAPIYGHSTSTFVMNGGEICHNTGISYGGVDVPSSIKVEINGGYIGENISVVGNTNADVNGNANTVITGGTFTQDVSAWLAPDTGLVYDEATGTYGITDHVYNLWFRDPVTGEQLPYVGPLQGNDPASLVATGKSFYANYYVMELEVLCDAKIDETIVIDYPMTVNLNGHTITAIENVYPMIRVQGGADVTVKGGNMTNETDYVFVLGASDGSSAGNLTIEGGKYVGNTTVASVTKGELTIKDGEFEVTESEYGAAYLLNCVDANYRDGSAKIVVEGGKFKGFNPEKNAAEGANTNFVANGYKAVDNGDGTYGISVDKDALDPVVEIKFTDSNGNNEVTLKYPSERYDTIQKLIGTNDYSDFVLGATQSELLAYIADGRASNIVITLHDDIELDAPLSFYNKYFQIPVEYAVTLNGNGHTITWADGYTGTLLNVESGVSLTLENVTIDGENAFTFYSDTTTVENGQNWYTRFVDVGEEDMAVNADVIVNAGSLTLGEGTKIQNVTVASTGDNGKTENTETGYILKYNDDLAIIKSTGGKVTMNGASIIGNAGMVLNADNTTTALTNAKVEGNMFCGRNGGGFDLLGGTMTITNSSISNNKGMARCATIIGVTTGAVVTMEDGSEINGNKHIGVGGNTAGSMIVVREGSKFVMNGGSISNNVGGRAGAIASRWAEGTAMIELNKGEITGNTASNDSWNGASIFLRSPATIGEGMKVDGVISVNAAPGELAITGGTFNAPEGTVGLIVADGLTASITGGTFNYDPAEWCAEGYTPEKNEDGTWTVEVTKVAQVGDVKYESLSAAIAAATADQTITLLAKVEENVTIDKNITIDGANFEYTGTMTVSNGKTVTVGNVNFVKGCIDKAKGTSGTLTIKNCDFDGVDNSINYAVTMRGGNAVTMEGCTSKNYDYGMLYIPSAVSNVTVKDTTAEGGGYGVHVAYGTNVTLDNVKMINVAYGIMTQNYGAKTITIKNCEISGTNPIYVWERNTTVVDTFKFVGANTVSVLPTSAQAKLVLAEADAVLKAPEGANVTTTVEGYEVEHIDGAYQLVEIVRVAKIGDVQYKTLQAAITAAKTGENIELLANVTEDVTVDKSLIIDGVDFEYTGTMTVNTSLTVTVQNVNFVKGCILEAKGTGGNLTVKNCNFDGVDNSIAYAVTMRGGNAVTMEGCASKNYDYGMLYVPSAVTNVTVKDTTAEGGGYGIHVAYGTNVTLDNVKMIDVAYGVMTQNYGAKTIRIKNCEISGTNPIYVWERNTTVVDTFVFEGTNKVENLAANAQGKYELADGATLTAPEGLTVTTKVDGKSVMYGDGKYFVGNAVAQIGEDKYASLQAAINAAQNGEAVVLLADIDITNMATGDKLEGLNTLFKVEGKSITVDLNGKTISGAYTDTTTLLLGVFLTDNNGHLTLKNGTVDITGNDMAERASNVYSLIANYEDGSSITIEDGIYKLNKAHDCLLYTGGNEGIIINGGSFTLGNVGDGTNGKPWIFNGYGQNANHVIVNGGTFNSDVNHQFWANEVFVPETLALENNGDGTWTVVEAVAYAVEKATSTNASNRNVGYATLAEAVAAKTTEIYLLADNVEEITVNKALTIYKTDKRFYADNISVANGYKLTETKEAYIIESTEPVAMIGDVEYASVTDALAAAKSGEIIKLVKDAEADMVIVYKGVTLDLNGYTLTANFVNAFAGNHIVDNSTAKSGLLKTAKSNLALATDNAQLPVWNETGYSFLTVGEKFFGTNGLVKSQCTEDKLHYIFQPDIKDLLTDGAENDKLDVLVELSWISDGKSQSLTFEYMDDDLIEYSATSANGRLTVSVTNLTGLENVSVKAVIVSELGVRVESGIKYHADALN